MLHFGKVWRQNLNDDDYDDNDDDDDALQEVKSVWGAAATLVSSVSLNSYSN